jgi:hypothetical protein
VVRLPLGTTTGSPPGCMLGSPTIWATRRCCGPQQRLGGLRAVAKEDLCLHGGTRGTASMAVSTHQLVVGRPLDISILTKAVNERSLPQGEPSIEFVPGRLTPRWQSAHRSVLAIVDRHSHISKSTRSLSPRIQRSCD